jgi:hypothetical protein
MGGFFRWLAGIPSDVPVTLGESQARLFAAQFVRRMARQVLMTMTWVRRGATVIMAGAMSVTFEHQQDYLLSIGGTMLLAIAIPLGLDSLTFMCVKVLATWAAKTSSKITAACALVFSISASGYLNHLAPGVDVLRWVYVVAVVMIAVAETVAATLKPDFHRMAHIEAMLAPMATPVPEPAPEPAPVSVETPPAPPSEAPEVPTAEDAPVRDKPRPRPKRKRPPRTTISPGVRDRGNIIDATIVEPRDTAVVPVFVGPPMADPEADMG